MSLFPTAWGHPARASSLPTYNTADGPVTDTVPPMANSHVALPATVAQARHQGFDIDGLIMETGAQSRARRQAQIDAEQRRQQLATRTNWRETSRPSCRIIGALGASFWFINICLSLIVLTISKSLSPVVTYDCFVVVDEVEEWATRFTCKQKTWYIILWFALSVASLFDLWRRHFVTYAEQRFSRPARNWSRMWGPVVMAGIAIGLFAMAAYGQGCFKGCVVSPTGW